MTDAPRDEDWIWTRFWQFDRVASCLDGPDHAGYIEPVADGWRAFFGTLRSDARVLDLCTGNGAIALIAAAALPEARIDAIDRATIDPARHVRRHPELIGRIDFHGGVAAEKMPFADAVFDAIVSQYGFEYAERDAATAEVARLLAPGGRLRLVVHAADGAPCAGAAQVIADADMLLKTLALPDKAVCAVEAVTDYERGLSLGPEAMEAAKAAFAAFTSALDAARAYAPKARDVEMLDNTLFVLSDTYHNRRGFPVPALKAKIEEVRTEILAQRGRSAALRAAALTGEDMAAVVKALGDAGIACALSPLEVAGELVGYSIEGGRPD